MLAASTLMRKRRFFLVVDFGCFISTQLCSPRLAELSQVERPCVLSSRCRICPGLPGLSVIVYIFFCVSMSIYCSKRRLSFLIAIESMAVLILAHPWLPLVLLFSNLNEMIFGYFDPENIYLDNKNNYFSG